ncbi:hypothetical protein RZN05_00020 [Sphingomonas sp. HF-S4]|uniref:Uncharacterized protein n=1 Tax=Sphingomonas agrestis TaxID=3080540 RepID=A0ABU3Y1T8_9SPHN|nr:hypothetical protein [Sphingomonas sp. HF-S4]MDV3455350.1 hypothetical protein [Sphingomonas sp. HF-S4]
MKSTGVGLITGMRIASKVGCQPIGRGAQHCLKIPETKQVCRRVGPKPMAANADLISDRSIRERDDAGLEDDLAGPMRL